MSFKINKQGFTLVEVLVYAAGLMLVIGAVAGFLFYMYGWYRAATIGPRVDQVAISFISKLENDLRAGNSLDLSASSLDTAVGSTSINASIGACSTTTQYALANGRLTRQENNGPVVYMTPSDLAVTSFFLHHITTSVSTGVRFEISIVYPSGPGSATTTNVYDGLAIMRQSYQ